MARAVRPGRLQREQDAVIAHAPQSVLRDGPPQKIATKLLQTRAEHIAAALDVFYATYDLGMAAL